MNAQSSRSHAIFSIHLIHQRVAVKVLHSIEHLAKFHALQQGAKFHAFKHVAMMCEQLRLNIYSMKQKVFTKPAIVFAHGNFSHNTVLLAVKIIIIASSNNCYIGIMCLNYFYYIWRSDNGTPCMYLSIVLFNLG